MGQYVLLITSFLIENLVHLIWYWTSVMMRKHAVEGGETTGCCRELRRNRRARDQSSRREDRARKRGLSAAVTAQLRYCFP